MALTVIVDRDICIGAENCVNAAPGAFELDGEFKAVVVDQDAATEDQLKAAERNCPSGAIRIEEG